MWVDLKENTGEDVVGRTRRLFSRGNMLVMAQLSLSLMMLTAAGLFVHSAVRASNIQPGFALENQVLAEVDASLINYDQARGSQLYGDTERPPAPCSRACSRWRLQPPFRLAWCRWERASRLRTDAAVSKEHPAVACAIQHRERRLLPDSGNTGASRDERFAASESTIGIKEQGRDYRQAGGRKTVAGRRRAGQAHPLRLGRPRWAMGVSRGRREAQEAHDLEVVGVVGNVR